MKMRFGLEEDTNIEVPGSEESAESAAADQEANEAVEEASEGMEEVVDMGLNICEVIDNLTSLRAHVKKFGVTKQMLHLVNANNQLGNAIDIALPYYESDDEADDINEDDIPAEEVVMEGFGSAMKKAKDAVVKFFKWIWEKLKAFGTAIADFFRNYKKKIAGAKDKLKKGVDTDKIKEKKAKVMSFKDMEDRLKALNSAINAVKMWQAGDDMDSETLNAALKYAGKKIEGSVGSYKLAAVEKPEVKEDTLLALGWENAGKLAGTVEALFKYGDEIKKFEASIKKDEAKALKSAEDATEKKNITNGAAIKLSVFTAVSNEVLNTAKTYLAIVDRLPVKG